MSEASNFVSRELATQIRDTFRAIDNVIIRAHGPRARLKAPPVWGTPEPEVLARYGPGPLFELWCLLDAVNRLQLAFTGKGASAYEPPPEPDEAPGLTVEPPPPADVGADQQQRLAMTSPEHPHG
jgi:hypothetical protein